MWKWAVILAILLIDVAWAYAAGITVHVKYGAFAAALAFVAGCYVYAKRRGIVQISELANAGGQLIAFNSVLAVLMYLAATLNYPLVDERLAHVDSLLGFDWLATFNAVRAIPSLQIALSLAYASILPQVFIVLVLLNILGKLDRAREFITLYFVLALITVPFSALMPAASAWVHFGVTDQIHAYHLAHLTALRDGTMTTIDLAGTDGIITFPSFHTALAIIYIYVTRGLWIWPIVLIANVAMIASVPTEGGHYLVDVLAGAGFTFACIALMRLSKRQSVPNAQLDSMPA